MKKVFFLAFLCISLGLHAQTDSIHQIELSEVVVSATRANRRTPTTFTNLRATEVSRIMVMPEIPSAIGLSPSVVTTSDNGAAIGYQSFRVRGSDASRINVTFDGVPVNDGESQAVFWANMPNLLSSLQTMQIQRGVGTSTNGSAAFGATLNMQSAQPAVAPYASASAAYGSFNTFKIDAAAGTGRFQNGWNADMRYSLGQTDGYIDNGFVDQYSMFFGGGYSSSQRIVKLNIFHGDQKNGISWNGVPDTMIFKHNNRKYNYEGLYVVREGRYDNQTDNYRQTHLHLHYIEQLSEQFRLNTTLYYTRGLGYYEQYRYRDRVERYIQGGSGRPNMIRQKWLDNHLLGAIVNASYTTEKTRADFGLSGNVYDNEHYGKILMSTLVIEEGYEWYRNNGKKSDISAFFKVTQQIYDRLYAFGDVQWRRIGYEMTGDDDDYRYITDLTYSKDYNFFNPKLGITFVISPEQRAYASFSVGNREPSRADIKEAIRDREHITPAAMPRHETLYNVETGYEINSNVFTTGVNFFYMHYKNQLVNIGSLNESYYALMENVPVSYRTGIELIFGVRPVRTLQINGNLTYSSNKIKDYVAVVNADDYTMPRVKEYHGTTNIAYSPKWVGAADISYEIVRGLTISWTAKYVGEQYYDNTSSDDRLLEAYFVNNAIVHYRHDFDNFYAGLQFAVNNIWNADYFSNATVIRGYYDGDKQWIERNLFPQPLRNYMLKLTIGFN